MFTGSTRLKTNTTQGTYKKRQNSKTIFRRLSFKTVACVDYFFGIVSQDLDPDPAFTITPDPDQVRNGKKILSKVCILYMDINGKFILFGIRNIFFFTKIQPIGSESKTLAAFFFFTPLQIS
jgi:hypothetical protein